MCSVVQLNITRKLPCPEALRATEGRQCLLDPRQAALLIAPAPAPDPDPVRVYEEGSTLSSDRDGQRPETDTHNGQTPTLFILAYSLQHAVLFT